jgi:hypothetical protein
VPQSISGRFGDEQDILLLLLLGIESLASPAYTLVAVLTALHCLIQLNVSALKRQIISPEKKYI